MLRAGLSAPMQALAGALLLLALAACERPAADNQAGAAKAKAPPPPEVTVARPLVKEIVEWDEYTARFDAVEMVEVRARISGYLNDVAFKDGAIVRKGDLLFVIDPRPFERALEQAKAELGYAQTKAENLVRDVERGKTLVDRKIMSDKVYDDRVNAQREAEAQVKIAEAKVRTAELDLSFTRVSAPITGRISRSLMSPGAYVSGGGTGAPTVLTSIVSQDPIHLYFDINDNNAIKYKRLAEKGGSALALQAGAPALVALPDETEFKHKGVLDFLDNRLDSGTGTLRARAAVANPAGLFAPGLFARIRIAGSPKYPAIMVPDSAIGTDQASKFLLVVAEDGAVARRTVTIGPLVDGMRVVRTGLVAEDWVVVNGLQRARPGGRVTPKRHTLEGTAGQASTPAAPGAPKQP